MRKHIIRVLPEVIPSWIALGHAVYPIWVPSSLGTASIAESTAPTRVDGYEYNKDDDVEDGDVVPDSAHLLQHSGFA